MLVRRSALLLLFCSFFLHGGSPFLRTPVFPGDRTIYSWETRPVGNTAQLVTLLCHAGTDSMGVQSDVPVLSIMKDTLGDDRSENDRLTSVWILGYKRPTVGQRVLSAIPFFYWRVGNRSDKVNKHDTAPLLDLTSPQSATVSELEHRVLQWGALDPAGTLIRASSRAYRTNELDHERVHLDEAIGHLRAVAANNPPSLTSRELNAVIARLELRKKSLGGFVRERDAVKFGERKRSEDERIRSRNWELLRQCADKTGLYFEPLDLAGTVGRYAMLWFPVGEPFEFAGTQLGPVWKLLNIKDPRRDENLVKSSAIRYTQARSASGILSPLGATDAREVKLFPLGVYSLDYPTAPLLMVDFRNTARNHWKEVTQRSINELVAGVIGISYFTNWYYYAAADLYSFIAARHGAAMNQSERLGCYSEFRMRLALDHTIDSALRAEMQRQVDLFFLNPLDETPAQEREIAVKRYQKLKEGQSGQIVSELEKNRRAEMARYQESKKRNLYENVLHELSFGTYTHRAKRSPENLASIDRYRRVQYQLNFLNELGRSGTQPEIAHDPARIRRSITELRELLPDVESRGTQSRAAAILQRLSAVSKDTALQADCLYTIASIETNNLPSKDGVAAKSAAIRMPRLEKPEVGIGMNTFK